MKLSLKPELVSAHSHDTVADGLPRVKIKLKNEGDVKLSRVSFFDDIGAWEQDWDIPYESWWPTEAGSLLPGETAVIPLACFYGTTNQDQATNSIQFSVTGDAGALASVQSRLMTDVQFHDSTIQEHYFVDRADYSGLVTAKPEVKVVFKNATDVTAENITFENVSFGASLPWLAAPSIAWDGAVGVLLPGQSAVMSGILDTNPLTYTTSTNLGDHSFSYNTVDGPVSRSRTLLLMNAYVGAIAGETMSASPFHPNSAVGDQFNYSYTLQNTGNCIISEIEDYGNMELEGFADPIELSYALDPLGGNTTVSGVTTYTVTASDITSSFAYPSFQMAFWNAELFSNSSGPSINFYSTTYVGPADTTSSPSIKSLSIPAISGIPLPGNTLTVSPGEWSPTDVELVYEWRTGEVLLGTGTTYTVKESDRDNLIHARVTASKAGLDSLARHALSVWVPSATPLPIHNIAVNQAINLPDHVRAGAEVIIVVSVYNSGGFTVSGLDLDFSLPVTELTVHWPDESQPGVMPPETFASASAFYTLMEEDLIAGALENTLAVQAFAPAVAAVTKTITKSILVQSTSGPIYATLEELKASYLGTWDPAWDAYASNKLAAGSAFLRKLFTVRGRNLDNDIVVGRVELMLLKEVLCGMVMRVIRYATSNPYSGDIQSQSESAGGYQKSLTFVPGSGSLLLQDEDYRKLGISKIVFKSIDLKGS